MDRIEVYLRPSGDRVLLNIYVPKAQLKNFLSELKSGSYANEAVPIAFEAHVQSEWQRGADGQIRVPISAINLTVSD